jgi:hypothetical protein
MRRFSVLAALMLGPALAGDRQHILAELNVDVVLSHSGDVAPEHVVLTILDQIHRRDPAALQVAASPHGVRVEEAAGKPVHVLLDAAYTARDSVSGAAAQAAGGAICPYLSDPGVVSASPVSRSVFSPDRIIGQPPYCSGLASSRS